MESLINNLKQIGINIKEYWNKLTLNQKVIGSGIGLLIVIALVILLFSGRSSQSMEVLYTDLTDKDAAAIVEKLEEEKYRTNWKTRVLPSWFPLV